MHLLLASGNPHKRREFAALFPEDTILTPPHVGLDFDHPETGTTFLENALGKAQALRKLCESSRTEKLSAGIPLIIADDSGICVDALDGGPGLYSARFGSELQEPPQSDEERTALLLKRLEGRSDRSAHYVCAMVALFTMERFAIAQEIWEGRITNEVSSGTGGFGYDPVFLVPELGMTVADIGDERKHRISHRGKAAAQIRKLL
jgi:XTP/dITP diphosphohydrolase